MSTDKARNTERGENKMEPMDSAPRKSDLETTGRRRYRMGFWAAAALGFIAFLLLSGVAVTLSPYGKGQPIAFNHQKHVAENDMECSECHEYYERETFSGVPGADVCSFCHEESLGESAEEAKLVKLLQEGASLEWEPLFRQPPHVFFSHRRHVAVAQMDCSDCHGSIGESDTPPERVKQLTMDDCMDCHLEKGARDDCTTCHR